MSTTISGNANPPPQFARLECAFVDDPGTDLMHRACWLWSRNRDDLKPLFGSFEAFFACVDVRALAEAHWITDVLVRDRFGGFQAYIDAIKQMSPLGSRSLFVD